MGRGGAGGILVILTFLLFDAGLFDCSEIFIIEISEFDSEMLLISCRFSL